MPNIRQSPRRRWSGLGCAIVAGLVILVTGSACVGQTTPAAEPTGEPVLHGTPAVDDKTLTLPLDPYMVRGEQQRFLGRAQQILAEECVRRFGFEVTFPPPLRDPLGLRERRYGLADLARAQREGYRVSEISDRPSPPEPELSPEVETLVSGLGPKLINGLEVPEGGCSEEARRRLSEGSDPPGDANLGQELDIQSHQRARQDTRVVAAAGAWSQCMRRQGHDYADPYDAMGDPAFATARVTEREITVATADVRCKQEVDYVAIFAAVDAAYQRRFVERDFETLEQIRVQIETQVRNATRIVGPA